jgi:hypothetical protein
MGQPLKLLLFLFGITQICTTSADNELFNPFQLLRRQVFPEYEGAYEGRAYSENYFTQKLDHIDVLETRTWQQVKKNKFLL